MLGLLPIIAACGGSVAKHDASAQGEAGAPALPQGSPTETIDDMDPTGGQYPATPAGSSSFFWRLGLGNWFVNTSDGQFQDAPIEPVPLGDGTRANACHVRGTGEGVSVDLWAQLNHPSGTPLDLSAYSGIAVSVRLVDPSGKLTLGFNLNGQFPGDADITAEQSFRVNRAWQRLTLPFADVAVDAAAVSSVDFVVVAPDAPFDLFVRDLALTCNGACP